MEGQIISKTSELKILWKFVVIQIEPCLCNGLALLLIFARKTD